VSRDRPLDVIQLHCRGINHRQGESRDRGAMGLHAWLRRLAKSVVQDDPDPEPSFLDIKDGHGRVGSEREARAAKPATDEADPVLPQSEQGRET
jgi:hypothetical protein